MQKVRKQANGAINVEQRIHRIPDQREFIHKQFAEAQTSDLLLTKRNRQNVEQVDKQKVATVAGKFFVGAVHIELTRVVGNRRHYASTVTIKWESQ